MIVSLNWLKKFVNINISVDDLVELINKRLVEIDSVTEIGKKYDKVLIVKVIEAKPLKGSDHLSVLRIDDGQVVKDIDRDEDGFIQVVCGAPNIATGQMVVWLPPKSVVPQTFGTDDPFTLDTRNLRGTVSNGMIASAKELDLFDDHSGILVLDTDAKPGSLFAKIYELDDYLLNIENKSLTHRPDCFGIIGFAREVAAILDQKFENPDWILNQAPAFKDIKGRIGVTIDDAKLSDRYQAIVMEGGDSKKTSPVLIQTYLSRVGIRPISAIVDVTNYLMILTGQPLHAFDYDKMAKVAGNTYDYEIHVRAGRKGEKLELLDGRTIELSNEDIVIAAGETAVALAGAMGGASTEIDENTKSIIIESATFNLYKLRTTQMRHGIFSEAITRFTKGQPAQLTAPVLNEAVQLISEWAGMKLSTAVAEDYPGKKDKQIINVSLQKINDILGAKIDMVSASNLLGNAGFGVKAEDPSTMIIEVPYWRSDIHIVEDIAEEIGRINGFDNIKSSLPVRDFTAVCPNDFDKFRTNLRKILVRAGANEVLNYSFVHGDIIRKVDQKTENSYRLVNSISPDLQYFRQSLTPSLLGLIHPNIKQGNDNFALFEINKCHRKSNGLNDEKVPVESDSLALTIVNKVNQNGAAYYQSKQLVEYLCSLLNIKLVYQKFDKSDQPETAPFEYRRSAQLICDGVTVGFVGEYKKSVIKNFKLPEYIAGFEIDTRALFEASKSAGKTYKPISRYPATERDICFKVGQSIDCDQIVNLVIDVLNKTDLQTSVEVIDIYKKENQDTKNITIRIKLVSYTRTLIGEEINIVINNVVNSVIEKLDAVVI
jgi:phenylalanyl-tRNA synthetase beta chain